MFPRNLEKKRRRNCKNIKDMTEITNKIYYVGVNDRNKHRFEGLWPLPNGVSYNSYIIDDEKVALVDTV